MLVTPHVRGRARRARNVSSGEGDHGLKIFDDDERRHRRAVLCGLLAPMRCQRLRHIAYFEL